MNKLSDFLDKSERSSLENIILGMELKAAGIKERLNSYKCPETGLIVGGIDSELIISCNECRDDICSALGKNCHFSFNKEIDLFNPLEKGSLIDFIKAKKIKAAS